MAFIDKELGYLFLLLFGLFMIVVTTYFTKKGDETKEGFLVADRKISWLLGGPSIAASWLWAGALFVSTQMAYTKGIAGAFWFIFPNFLALALFAIWAPKIKEKFPKGYTLPQFIKEKFQNTKLHKLYLIPFVFNQIIAITFNLFAGSLVIFLLTGIKMVYLFPILALIALSYTLISGLKASIVTDLIQIIVILSGILIIIPLVIYNAGGFMNSISAGLGGVSGQFTNIFDPSIMFTLGIINSIGLISGTIVDQQYWQRVFAIKKEDLKKAFIFGGFLFAIIPLALSLLGFIGANPNFGIDIGSFDSALIGIVTISEFLPVGFVILFCFMMISGLSSTIDSGISAGSSLFVTDVLNVDEKENVIKKIRYSMIGITLIGLLFVYLAYLVESISLQHLWFLAISIVPCVSIPTIMSVYIDDIDSNWMFYGILVAIVFGMSTFFYSNVNNLI